jgi:histidyl-tRNA synthetase
LSKKFQAVKGTRDLLPPETAIWAAVEAVARRVFGTYGYQEIRTPILEDTDLFVRSVGESTDIVGKEMYTFDDRKGRSLTLRPENTASVVRAFVQHGMQTEPLPVKLYYIGPQFRYERPQKGRYRQFHQIGAELIGDPGPQSDAEVILMLVGFLTELGFSDLVVQLNTVGDDSSRVAYGNGLREYLQPMRQALTADSQRRLETNPLRILDSKDPGDQELLREAPQLIDFLTPEARTHFAAVQTILARHEVAHRVEPRLVRGLDYYTHTVFEIVSAGLGAQDAIVGGGRYDGLVEELGGQSLPGIGFAIGQDRLIEVLPDTFRSAVRPEPPIAVVVAGSVAPDEALSVAQSLREAGLAAAAELAPRSVKAALKRAHRAGSRYVVMVGDEEIERQEVTVRDLDSAEQSKVARARLVDHFRGMQ